MYVNCEPNFITAIITSFVTTITITIVTINGVIK